MRPPEFTGGNLLYILKSSIPEAAGIIGLEASMRPPEFTGGNAVYLGLVQETGYGFNEAAGIHRRKHTANLASSLGGQQASMRPPEFTGGNDMVDVPFVFRDSASMRPPEFTGGNSRSLW